MGTIIQECYLEVTNFAIDRATNINKNVPLGAPAAVLWDVPCVFLWVCHWCDCEGMHGGSVTPPLCPAARACRRDVRKFCMAERKASDHGAILSCLKCDARPHATGGLAAPRPCALLRPEP